MIIIYLTTHLKKCTCKNNYKKTKRKLKLLRETYTLTTKMLLVIMKTQDVPTVFLQKGGFETNMYNCTYTKMQAIAEKLRI